MSDKAGEKGGEHPVAGYGNQRIVFENNTFEDNNGVNLLVTSAQDVKIIGNKFIRPNETAMEARGASWGEDSSATVNIFASKDVTLQGNTVIDPGQANKSLHLRQQGCAGDRSGYRHQAGEVKLQQEIR